MADLKLRAREAASLADSMAMLAKINGVKNPEPDDYNRWECSLYAIEARSMIEPESARIFLELLNQNRVPGWAVDLVDLKFIRAAHVL